MINKTRSFRYEIIIITLLSALCTILVEGGSFLLYQFIRRILMDGQKPHQEPGKVPPVEGGGIPQKFDMVVKEPDGGVRRMAGKSDDMIYICLAAAFIAGVLLFLCFFLLFTKKISESLKEIRSGIQEISVGNFESRITVKGNNEFAMIAEQVNHMTEQIQAILKEERQNEEVKNELITNVAHDLRTPLTSIIGYLYLLSNNNSLTAEQKEHYIEIAYNKSKRLEELIEDLFRFTKYNNEQMKLNIQKIDFVQLVEQMGEEFYPSMEQTGLAYHFHSNVKHAYIQADGNLLARAVANLMSNAVKYGKDGKEICVNLTLNQGKLELSIRNYGKVIPKEKLQHIFERFYRVEESRSEETGGSGLGLAIAQKIADMHHGSIHAESSMEGTVFYLLLNLYGENVRNTQ